MGGFSKYLEFKVVVKDVCFTAIITPSFDQDLSFDLRETNPLIFTFD
jgi:hypothetical protein